MTISSDRYQILDELGQGAMATVYKAYDPRMKRTLALKVLREDKTHDEELRNRFLREARAVGKLSHPNIVTIYDVGEIENRPFIAMEILHGQFLDHAMRAGARFSTQEVIDIVLQIASALDCAHSNGVIHRDIKPANIAWIADEKKAIVTDFGIAHVEKFAETEYTQAGQLLGTPSYMSPEQILGKVVDARSDLFSLGVVMYQLISGKKPFFGDTIAALAYQITHEQPKHLDDLSSDIPKPLIRIVNKLLEKDINKRYQDCGTLIDDLTFLKKQIASGTLGRRKIPLLPLTAVSLLIILIVTTVVLLLPEKKTVVPAVQTEPETHVAKQPVKPEDKNRISLEETINARLQAFECASLNASIGPNHAVVIKGYVSKEEDMLAIMDIADQIPNASNVTYEVSTLAWPFCEVTSILKMQREQNINQNYGLRIDTLSHTARLKQGDKLVVDVATPNYESYLYVDFYRSDGSVLHLYPKNFDSFQQVGPSKQIIIGKDQTWHITKPFGEGMLVAMAARNPLVNGKRGELEKSQDYLTFLHKQIVVNKHELTADYLMVSTEPK